MRTRLLQVAPIAVLALALAGQAADDKSASIIQLKNVPTATSKTKPGEPLVIKTADEAAKEFPDKEFQAALQKEVDFAKWQLVYFAWSGSGQDKLEHNVTRDGDKTVVEFTRTPGRTKDLRQHKQLYAIPKDATYKVKW